MAAPQGVALALDDPTLAAVPVWTRIDNPAGYHPITGWTIQRGRSFELDKINAGTASIRYKDTNGVLDPTNPGSPYWDTPNAVTKLDPCKQAAIALKNPVTNTWYTLYRGFVDELNGNVDVSEVFIEGTIELVDAFDIFEATEIIPDNAGAGRLGNLVPGESPGEVYYSVEQVDDRIKAAYRDAGWPDALAVIFSGNVEDKGVVYAPRSSILSVLQDAADSEFPGVANIYMSKEGILVFHGRFARFDYTNPDYGINVWACGDTTYYAGDPTVIPLFGLNFDRAKSHIINAVLSTPQDILDSEIAAQVVTDVTSINTFGTRSLSFENLITNGGDTGAGVTITDKNEVKKFSQYYVNNYKDPRTRIKQLVFKPVHTAHPNATALWDFMCRVELNDVIEVSTAHPGGGGFIDSFFVEGINYEAEPFNNLYPLITLTLDVSPVAYYTDNPF